MKDFKKNLQEGLAKTTEFLKSSAEKLSSVGPAAKEKAVEVVNDVLAVLPIIEDAGYRTNEFNIGIGLSPVIEISFSKFLDVPKEQIDALKEEHEDKKMFNMILTMLDTASSLAVKLNADDFNFYETVVEIGISPKVSLRYVNKKLDAKYINLLQKDD
jgi:hypothetical protein